MRELDGGLFQLQPWRLTLNGESEKSLRDTETCIVDKRVYGKLPVTQLQHFPKPLRSADYQGKTWICLHLRLFERLPIPLDTRQEWKDTSFLPWSCR
ncbi:MAG: hypothetical protein DMG41_18330 [Acidobacteria bacterium]|nr:MAG: hypothetical protein DMG42_16525 [Acidobacteriota bacterium]PYT86666.1 MAG: hypothetical protein DMG41_18330 [Acidobacteriota bacterium]